jgi:hypothetical protein
VTDPELKASWDNAEGCPPEWPYSVPYPEDRNDLYAGLTICFSDDILGNRDYVLSNAGDMVWAFPPGTPLGPDYNDTDYYYYTWESQDFRTKMIDPAVQNPFYLVPGEVGLVHRDMGQPESWKYSWYPGVQMTFAWTGYGLATWRAGGMVNDPSTYREIVFRKQYPHVSALATCAESTGEALTSMEELSDKDSALRKWGVGLGATSEAAKCVGAFKELETKVPEQQVRNVRDWPSIVEKGTGASSKAARIIDDMWRFCTTTHLPKVCP